MDNLSATVDALYPRVGFFLAWKPRVYVCTKKPRHHIPLALGRVVTVDTGGGGRLNLRIEYPVGSGTVWPSLAAASLQMQRDVRHVRRMVPAGFLASTEVEGDVEEDGTNTSELRPLGYDDIEYNVDCASAVDMEAVRFDLLSSSAAWRPLVVLLPVPVRNGDAVLRVDEMSILPPLCSKEARRALPPTHTTRQQPCEPRASLLSGWLLHDDEDFSFVRVPPFKKQKQHERAAKVRRYSFPEQELFLTSPFYTHYSNHLLRRPCPSRLFRTLSM